MNIIRITPDNWEKFRTIRLAALNSDPQAFGAEVGDEAERKEPEWRKRLASPDRFFFAVEEGDVYASIAGARLIEEKTWMLLAVHTLPESRGKGFAQALVDRVIEEARSRGADTIQLSVNIDQENAVHVY